MTIVKSKRRLSRFFHPDDVSPRNALIASTGGVFQLVSRLVTQLKLDRGGREEAREGEGKKLVWMKVAKVPQWKYTPANEINGNSVDFEKFDYRPQWLVTFIDVPSFPTFSLLISFLFLPSPNKEESDL